MNSNAEVKEIYVADGESLACRDLEHQITQLKFEKKVLLDQIAKFEVPMCFGCGEILPSIEANLENKKRRKLSRLHKLREECVRINHSYNSELNNLQNLEKDLQILNGKSEEMKCKIENETKNLNNMKENYTKLKNEEHDALNSQNNAKLLHQSEHHKETEYVHKEKDKLKRDLELLRSERDEIEKELFAICEYTKLKESELEISKSRLISVRNKVSQRQNALKATNRELQDLKYQMNVKKTEVERINNELTAAQKSLLETQNLIVNMTRAKVEAEREHVKIRRELSSLDIGIHRLRSVLKDHQVQYGTVESQCIKLESEINQIKLKLEDKNDELCDLVAKIELIETQRNDSFVLHENLRSQIKEEFIASRIKLNELRQEKDKINLEIQRLTCPVMRKKREDVEEKRRSLENAEIVIKNLSQTLEMRKSDLEQLKNCVFEIEKDKEMLNMRYEEENSIVRTLKSQYEGAKSEKEIIQDMVKSRETLGLVSERSIASFEQVKKLMDTVIATVNSDDPATVAADDAVSHMKNYLVLYCERNFETISRKILNNKEYHSDALQQQIENKKVENEELQQEISNLEAKSFALRENFEKEELKLNSLMNNLNETIRRQTEIEERLLAQQEHYNIMAENEVMWNNEVIEKQQQHNEIQKEVSNIQNEIDREKVRMVKAENELKNLQKQVLKLEVKISDERKRFTENTVMFNSDRIARRNLVTDDRQHGLNRIARECNKADKNIDTYPKVVSAESDGSP